MFEYIHLNQHSKFLLIYPMIHLQVCCCLVIATKLHGLNVQLMFEYNHLNQHSIF